MPRKNPLSSEDIAIARRLTELRKHYDLSREEVTSEVNVRVGVLTRLELARMPLRYATAIELLPGYGRLDISVPEPNPINPLWLAEGLDPMRLSWPMLLPTPSAIGLDPRITFSEFVSKHRELLTGLAEDVPDAELPESWLQPYLIHWAKLISHSWRVQTGASIVECVFQFSAERLASKSQAAATVLEEYRSAVSRLGQSIFQRKPLSKVTPSRNTDAVKSELASLRNRLRACTSRRGSKVVLADYLGVPLPRISEWLSGEVEPGGETTLRLLRWVELEEVAKEISPSGVTALPGPKTQLNQSKNEKRKSGPSG